MRNLMKHKLAPLALGLGLLTPLAFVQISCSKQPQDKADSQLPEISILSFANLKTPTTAWPTTTAASTWAMTQGSPNATTYLMASFGATGGTAVLTPGNIPVTSGVPVPLNPAATTTYKLTVTDASGHATSSSATLTVLAIPDPTISGPKAAIANTGGLTASAPVGPTSPAPGTTYKWIANNAIITSADTLPTITFTVQSTKTDGSADVATLSCTVTNPANAPYSVSTPIPFPIEVDAVPPLLAYASLTPICYQGLPMQIDLPVLTGAALGYSVSPALPDGLVLDAMLGTIQGTPTTIGTGVYTVTAFNSGGSYPCPLTINVQAQPSVVFNPASPAQILPGAMSTLSWSTGADVSAVTIVGNPVDASLPATFPLNGSANVTPAQNTTYTLTATVLSSSQPIVETQDVVLNRTPLAFSPDLTATSKVVGFGADANLNWGLTGIPTSVILNAPPSAPASVLGDTTFNAPVTRRQNFSITATNTLPSSATSSTVTVAATGLDTLAGNITQGGGNHDGVGIAAQLSNPGHMATDPAGNIYLADSGNHIIRMITPLGAVTTIAGSPGVLGGSTSDTDGLHAQFNNPKGVAYWVDTTATPAQPYLFVAEYGNNCVRRLTFSPTTPGLVTHTVVFAGTMGTTGTQYGNGSLQFDGPEDVVIDSNNNLYVPEWYNQDVAIVKNLNQPTSTVAGYVNTGRNQTAGFADGAIATAGLDHPTSIVLDSNNNMYIGEYTGNRVRKVNMTTGIISTIAGDNSKAAGAYGFVEGVGNVSRLNAPSGIALNGTTLLVADTKNQVLRSIDLTTNTTSTVVGAKPVALAGSTNGQGNAALLALPQGLVLSPDGKSIYIAEAGNNDIRVSDLAFNVTNFVGASPQIGNADSSAGAPNGAMAINPGLSTNNTMAGLAVDSANNVYVADTYNNTIRKIDPTGVMTTIAGIPGTAGKVDGVGSAATFNAPAGVAIDSNGNLFVVDEGNSTVRQLSYDPVAQVWNVTTIAGTAGVTGVVNGAVGVGTMKYPYGITACSDGNLYVADTGNKLIRALTPNATRTVWTMSTIAFAGFSLNTPMGIAADPAGNLYVAERYNYFVGRLVPPVSPATSWAATIIGGISGTGGFQDGPNTGVKATSSLFITPQGICVDGNGIVYVADMTNNTVRKITNAAGVWTTATVVGVGVSTINPPTTGVLVGTSVGSLPATLFSPQAVAVSPAGHDLFITTNGGVAQATAVDGN